jgi:hypothetical protein
VLDTAACRASPRSSIVRVAERGIIPPSRKKPDATLLLVPTRFDAQPYPSPLKDWFATNGGGWSATVAPHHWRRFAGLCMDEPEGWGLSFEMNGLNLLRGGRSKSLMVVTALAGLVAVPAAAQIAPPRPAMPAAAKPKPKPQAARPAPDAPVPGNPDFAPDAPDTAQAPAPAPLPPVVWDAISAEDLLHYILQVGADGLNPQDYDPEGLRTALAAGDPALLSAAAT